MNLNLFVFIFKRSRALASGLVAAINYILAFIATKTYYNLEMTLSIPGVICFYGVIGVIGFIVMYFTLPETELRSLEDIELHFSDNARSIFDTDIRINAAAVSNEKQTDAGNKDRY